MPQNSSDPRVGNEDSMLADVKALVLVNNLLITRYEALGLSVVNQRAQVEAAVPAGPILDVTAT